MVFVSAVKSDTGKGSFGVLLRKIHGELPGLNDLTFPRFGVDHLNGDIEIVTHNFLNIIDRDLPGGIFNKFIDHLFGQLQRDYFFIQGGLRQQ